MSDFFQNQMRASEVISSMADGEAEQYAPLPLGRIQAGEPVAFDLYLKLKPKESARPQIVRCCAVGDIFQEDWYEKLAKLNVQWLYFSFTDLDLVFAYLQKQADSFLREENHSEVEKAQCVCDLTQIWIMRFFATEESRTGEQIALALKMVDDLLGAVKHFNHNSLMLLELRKQNSHLYSHSVSCCLLGLAFAKYLGWPVKKARNFGLGALIHDIGYARLPRELMEKKEGPTEEDLAKIQRHPIEGFRMLQSLAHIPWEALQMVLRHHENGDGSGYPEGLKLNAIHPWGRILRIIDSYEELTAERPWHPAISPKEALWIMRRHWEESKIYDRYYLLAFINFLAGRPPRAAKG